MTKPTFHITTFGCQMNAADSDWLFRSLTVKGFSPSPVPDEADIHILNTCSVRDKPEQKVYSEIGRIRSVTRNNPNILVCVGGCVAQQAGETLFRRFSQVRLVFGPDGIASAPEAILRLLEEKRLRVSLVEFTDSFAERGLALAPKGPNGAQTVPPAVFVSIMQGCNNFCAYCIVPYVRGRQKSREPEAVLNECASLIERGAAEITLLGQNVNAYGQDGEKNPAKRGAAFRELLYRVGSLPGLKRLRFVTAHPRDMGVDSINAFADIPCLADRLHLPLQSGSDAILKRMGRGYDTAKFLSLVQELRKTRPQIHFSTDIIVGFPGETEEQFEETLHFMETVGFVSSYSFLYSARPGTRAALLPDTLGKKNKLERLSRLQAWQDAFSQKILASLQGDVVQVLLESSAAPKNAAPDGIYRQGREGRGHGVIVRMNPSPEPLRPNLAENWVGKLVPVRITGAGMYGLTGDLQISSCHNLG
ncbi:tRNA-2-methylthio-N(6)-dimethylallyladenosine synthase [Deltaproteobacteria bacterium]|nr:tRNA-2-methylthio-N(6)-dimethylallyladenosine synthase [Deltaproteobacteria bacterium]